MGPYGFVPGSHGNFYTGDFDLLLTSRITEKANVLAEIVFAGQDAQKFGVDLERVPFKYDYELISPVFHAVTRTAPNPIQDLNPSVPRGQASLPQRKCAQHGLLLGD